MFDHKPNAVSSLSIYISAVMQVEDVIDLCLFVLEKRNQLNEFREEMMCDEPASVPRLSPRGE